MVSFSETSDLMDAVLFRIKCNNYNNHQSDYSPALTICHRTAIHFCLLLTYTAISEKCCIIRNFLSAFPGLHYILPRACGNVTNFLHFFKFPKKVCSCTCVYCSGSSLVTLFSDFYIKRNLYVIFQVLA